MRNSINSVSQEQSNKQKKLGFSKGENLFPDVCRNDGLDPNEEEKHLFIAKFLRLLPTFSHAQIQLIVEHLNKNKKEEKSNIDEDILKFLEKEEKSWTQICDKFKQLQVRPSQLAIKLKQLTSEGVIFAAVKNSDIYYQCKPKIE